MLKRIVISMICVIFSSAIYAKGKGLNASFRPLSSEAVQSLLDRDINNIGDLDLEELIFELQTVNWGGFNAGFLIGSGRRTTSVYTVEERRVTINIMELDGYIRNKINLKTWSLHEALGALGYDDENYERSLALRLLIKQHESLSFEKKLGIVKGLFSRKKLDWTDEERVYPLLAEHDGDGGGSVVGGGGDAYIIFLKEKILNFIIDKYATKLSAFKLRRIVQKFLVQAIEFEGNGFEQESSKGEVYGQDSLILIHDKLRFIPSHMYRAEFYLKLLKTMGIKLK